MKKDFLKHHWLSIVMVAGMGALSVYYMSLFYGIATAIFLFATIMLYRNYDFEEQVREEWWKQLSKETKEDIYLRANGGEEVSVEEEVE